VLGSQELAATLASTKGFAVTSLAIVLASVLMAPKLARALAEALIMAVALVVPAEEEWFVAPTA